MIHLFNIINEFLNDLSNYGVGQYLDFWDSIKVYDGNSFETENIKLVPEKDFSYFKPKLSETLIVYSGGASSMVKNNVHHRACDLSNTSNVLSLIDDVREVFDNIDILVNSAGIFPVKDFVDLDLDSDSHIHVV